MEGARRLECRVQGDRQLDNAEAGADMTTRARADVDEPRPDVVSETFQLVARQAAKVRW